MITISYRHSYSVLNQNSHTNTTLLFSTLMYCDCISFLMRISDILQLHFCDIIKDGDRYRLNISEIKTGKERVFTVPEEIQEYIDEYRIRHNMTEQQRLFDLSERQIQKHLKATCEYLGFDGVSTHSFRKYFATQIYINNGYNIELVRQILQHSSAAVTQRYIGIQQKQVEVALQNHIKLVI